MLMVGAQNIIFLFVFLLLLERKLIHFFPQTAVFVWCLSADLRIRPMILVVKKWARHHQINDASKGTLSSYTLVLMVLHYLQSQYTHTYR